MRTQRFAAVICRVLVICSLFTVVGCGEEAKSDSKATLQPLAKPAAATAVQSPVQSLKAAPATAKSNTGEKKKAAFAPLGGEKKKAAFAPLGGDKPKFALRNDVGSPRPGFGKDRAAEVKRLIDAYKNIGVRYTDSLVLAKSPEEFETARNREPSARSLRPIATLLANVIATDPTDEPALEGLTFFAKYIGVAEIDAVFEKSKIDPLALLLEHHSGNPKMTTALRRLQRGDTTDAFLQELFDKTLCPEVRWSSGAQLISSHRRNERPKAMEPIVVAMSEDRYLEGVEVGGKAGGNSARQWAIDKLREIRTLAIGKPIPEVSGTKLDGKTGKITDYRGKVVVLDVWTTWCGPCNKMIPHQVEMVERLKDKPFVLLSVSCDSERETLEEFLKETEMPWDHWWVGKTGMLYEALNISSFPSIFVIDAKGVIRHKNLRDEQLDSVVDALIAEIEKE